MNDPVMPADIANDIRYTNAGRQGDGFPCELRLKYLDETKTPPEDSAFQRQWVMTGTDWDPAAERGEEKQLEEETRARYQEAFLGRIRAELHRSKTVLVRSGGRVVRRA